MTKKWFGVLLIAMLAGIAGFNLYNDRKSVTDVQPAVNVPGTVDVGIGLGEQAPDFTVKTMDGEEAKLSDFQGKTVFLNFWATWCPPCKAEMPHMQAFYEDRPDDVEIIAVNIKESPERAAEFAEQYGLTFPILMDESGSVSEQYEVLTIPTTYVLNKDGTVHQKIVGPMDEAIMNDLLP